MKGLFVINPNAGMRMFQQGAHEVAKHLLQNGTIDYCSILYTRKGGDAFEITSSLKPGEWDFVLAAGGDGMSTKWSTASLRRTAAYLS